MSWEKTFHDQRAKGVGATYVIEPDFKEWPFLAVDAVWKLDQNNRQVLSTGCGGCFVGDGWVLTSGHCGFDVDGFVHVGLKPQPRLLPIERSHGLPLDGRDLKIAKISAASRESPFPWVGFYEGNPSPGEEISGAWYVGWGKFFETCDQVVHVPLAGKPTKIELTVRVSSDGRRLTIVDEAKALCTDDSGGPLLVQKDGEWKLLGIAQRGSCNCLPGERGVFDFVASLADQIRQALV